MDLKQVKTNKYEQELKDIEIEDPFDENQNNKITAKMATVNKPAPESTMLTEYELIKNKGFYFNYEFDLTNMSNLEPNSKHTILFDHVIF